MKKLLISILSVILLVSMSTTNIFAAGNEAKIGSYEYPTLQQAIDAVNNGEEIIVIDNIVCGTSITINNGKTFTINFNDGSTQRSFKWDVTSGSTINQNIFTIDSNSNVTVEDIIFLVGDTEEQHNTIFKVKTSGLLKLSNMTLNDGNQSRNIPVVNDGGTVVIYGGNITTKQTEHSSFSPNALNPVVQNLGGITTFTGNGTYTINSSMSTASAVWLGDVITTNVPSADPDNDCGTVVIENGIFNNGPIVTANGKGNVTINNATLTSTSTPAASAMLIYHGGIKSNITVNNIESSTNIFTCVYDALETKIDFQNGNVIYEVNKFCPSVGFSSKAVSIKNGKFGPSDPTADIEAEITNFLAEGAAITPISEVKYTYQVETATPPPAPPTPPTPTPEPDPEPTPVYIIPNTGVEGTPTNNHSLLKISSLSLLAIGTYMVIKKKKDN